MGGIRGDLAKRGFSAVEMVRIGLVGEIVRVDGELHTYI